MSSAADARSASVRWSELLARFREFAYQVQHGQATAGSPI
jgi:hypothetical protein